MVFEKLISNSTPISETIHEVKASGLPTVLYGAGIVANLTYDFLINNQIRVDVVAIDKEYFDDTTDKFNGIKMEQIDELIDYYKHINLFIGFYTNDLSAIVNRKIESLTKKGLKVNVYILDFHLLMYPERIFNHKFVIDNIKEFEWLYNRLADQRSKDVLVAFINQRISMLVEELDLVRDNNQYFSRSIIKLDNNEVYVDCGAYDGDTVFRFIEALKDQTDGQNYDGIYALEPNKDIFQVLYHKLQHMDRTYLINKGAWSIEGELNFSSFADYRVRSSRVDELGSNIIYVTKIDNILSGEKVSFIKMDIEGAEFEAIKGAEYSIKQFHPKLAICIYHKNEDLLTIPRYLHMINADYSLYLRAYESKSGEVVLYAVE